MEDTRQYLLDNETHRVVEVPGTADLLLMLKLKIEQLQKENDRLKEENRQLKNDNANDNTIAMLKQRVNELTKEMQRGFPISEDEYQNIWEFIKEHDAKHGGAGAISGRYTYEFLPTSVGWFGTIKCGSCGEEFQFCRQ